MALHRDIYWVGRQWAVTGYGMQACDQKQKGKFDIEASRLWDDDVLESLRANAWLNLEDFDKALSDRAASVIRSRLESRDAGADDRSGVRRLRESSRVRTSASPRLEAAQPGRPRLSNRRAAAAVRNRCSEARFRVAAESGARFQHAVCTRAPDSCASLARSAEALDSSAGFASTAIAG